MPPIINVGSTWELVQLGYTQALSKSWSTEGEGHNCIPSFSVCIRYRAKKILGATYEDPCLILTSLSCSCDSLLSGYSDEELVPLGS